MALKRKRASSPIFSKTQNHFRDESYMHSISPSSSTSWSSISSTTSSCVSEPHTPHDGSPLSNLKNSARSRKPIFDARQTSDTVSLEAETRTIDTWRMETDSHGNGGSDVNMNVSLSGIELQCRTDSESLMEAELQANPSGRTRKRLRDSRPDANVIHENTLKKLFDAQRGKADGPHSQQPNQRRPQSLSTLDVAPPSSLTTLDSFLGLSTINNSNKNENLNTNLTLNKRPVLQRLLPYNPYPSSCNTLNTPNGVSSLFSRLHTATSSCEDCDTPFPSSSQTHTFLSNSTPSSYMVTTTATGAGRVELGMAMMDIDSGGANTSTSTSMMDEDSLRQEFACRVCARLVCDYCACVMDQRRCLACATSGVDGG